MRVYDMAFFLIICILLILAAALCVYLVTLAAWRKIDIISTGTADYIRTLYDSDFDEEKFRGQLRGILGELDFLRGNRVIFHTPFYEWRKNRRALNAHTGFPGQRLIILTPGWAARLHREFCLSSAYNDGQDENSQSSEYACSRDDSDHPHDHVEYQHESGHPYDHVGRGMMTDLLIFVLGHEMAHKEAQYRPLFLFGRKRICAARIREIDADLGGIRKSGLSAGRVSACINSEILRKRPKYKDSRSDAELMYHPSWEFRIRCMKEGKMSGEMIDEICSGAGVSDRKFRERMKKFFCDRNLNAA